MKRFPIGSVATLYFDVIASGVGQTGQAAVVAIVRRADGRWFSASAGAFQQGYVENAMRELDATNLPGLYGFDFNHASDELVSTDFLIKYSNAGPAPILRYDEMAFGPLPAAAAPGLCSIQGTIVGADGRPRAGELVQVTLIPVFADALGRGFESDAIVRARSAADGSFDLAVVRGATIRLEIRAIGYDRRALVPNQPSILFTNL